MLFLFIGRWKRIFFFLVRFSFHCTTLSQTLVFSSINEKKNIGHLHVHLATQMNIVGYLSRSWLSFVVEILPNIIFQFGILIPNQPIGKDLQRSGRIVEGEGKAALLRLDCSIEDTGSSWYRREPSPHRSISDRGIAKWIEWSKTSNRREYLRLGSLDVLPFVEDRFPTSNALSLGHPNSTVRRKSRDERSSWGWIEEWDPSLERGYSMNAMDE